MEEKLEYSLEEWEKNDLEKKKVEDLLWITRAISKYHITKGFMSARMGEGLVIQSSESEIAKLKDDDFSFVYEVNPEQMNAKAKGKVPSAESLVQYLAYRKRNGINYFLHFYDSRLEKVKLPYSSVGPFEKDSMEEAKGIADSVMEGSAVVIKDNGFVVVGKTREELVSYLDRMYFSLEVVQE